MQDLIERIKKYNETFDEYKEENQSNKSFEIIEGKIPVLISAPHSVRQIRNGKIKGKDMLTGAIVKEITRRTSCWGIYKTRNNNDDASYDIENNNYFEKALQIMKENNVKMFLDIHGAKDNEEFDIDIGTSNKENLNGREDVLKKIIDIFNKNGIQNIGIDQKFKANTMHTLTKKIALNVDIPCMQIEITKKYRDLDQINNLEKVLNAITESVELYQ